MNAQELVIALRFKAAAIRQLLQDRGHEMTEEQYNQLLDEWNELTTLIEKLEKAL